MQEGHQPRLHLWSVSCTCLRGPDFEEPFKHLTLCLPPSPPCREFTSYCTRVWSQQTRNTEVLVAEKLQAAVEQLLEQHQARMNSLPEVLIVYRDGVSNGQFQAVLAEEATAIREVGPPLVVSLPVIRACLLIL